MSAETKLDTSWRWGVGVGLERDDVRHISAEGETEKNLLGFFIFSFILNPISFEMTPYDSKYVILFI